MLEGVQGRQVAAESQRLAVVADDNPQAWVRVFQQLTNPGRICSQVHAMSCVLTLTKFGARFLDYTQAGNGVHTLLLVRNQRESRHISRHMHLRNDEPVRKHHLCMETTFIHVYLITGGSAGNFLFTQDGPGSSARACKTHEGILNHAAADINAFPSD